MRLLISGHTPVNIGIGMSAVGRTISSTRRTSETGYFMANFVPAATLRSSPFTCASRFLAFGFKGAANNKTSGRLA
jgi:hypothetical protein